MHTLTHGSCLDESISACPESSAGLFFFSHSLCIWDRGPRRPYPYTIECSHRASNHIAFLLPLQQLFPYTMSRYGIWVSTINTDDYVSYSESPLQSQFSQRGHRGESEDVTSDGTCGLSLCACSRIGFGVGFDAGHRALEISEPCNSSSRSTHSRDQPAAGPALHVHADAALLPTLVAPDPKLNCTSPHAAAN